MLQYALPIAGFVAGYYLGKRVVDKYSFSDIPDFDKETLSQIVRASLQKLRREKDAVSLVSFLSLTLGISGLLEGIRKNDEKLYSYSVSLLAFGVGLQTGTKTGARMSDEMLMMLDLL